VHRSREAWKKATLTNKETEKAKKNGYNLMNLGREIGNFTDENFGVVIDTKSMK